MSAHRVTMEFAPNAFPGPFPIQTTGSQSGWTESWYDPFDTGLNAAIARGQQLVLARLNVLSGGWMITAFRVSALDANFRPLRRGALVFTQPNGRSGLYNRAIPGMDEQPYDALEIAVRSAGGFRRSFSLRGIGNDVVGAGTAFLNPPEWVRRFPSYADVLTGVGLVSPWAIRYRTGMTTGVLTAVFIGQAGSPAAADPQHPVLLVFGAGPITQGMVCNITGALGVSRLNGTWVVSQPPAAPILGITTVYLARKRRTTIGGSYTSGGNVQFWNYALDQVQGLSPGYGTSRRTGRPPALVRGRRSNRTS